MRHYLQKIIIIVKTYLTFTFAIPQLYIIKQNENMKFLHTGLRNLMIKFYINISNLIQNQKNIQKMIF